MTQYYSECYNTGAQCITFKIKSYQFFLFDNPRKFQPSKFFGYAVCSTAKHPQVSDKTDDVHEQSHVHPVILISSIEDSANHIYHWHINGIDKL